MPSVLYTSPKTLTIDRLFFLAVRSLTGLPCASTGPLSPPVLFRLSSPADSIILVFTTSIGVVTNDAIVPDAPALTAVIATLSIRLSTCSCAYFVGSSSSPAASLRCPFRSSRCPFNHSKIGNWIPVNGRFRAASAVYPFHNFVGCRRNCARTFFVALIPVAWEGPETICAFCLRTSAGVRMKQETSSAVLEAAVWAMGCGREVSARTDLTAS